MPTPSPARMTSKTEIKIIHPVELPGLRMTLWIRSMTLTRGATTVSGVTVVFVKSTDGASTDGASTDGASTDGALFDMLFDMLSVRSTLIAFITE